MTLAGSEALSLDELLVVFRRHWRRMVQVALVAGLVAGTYAIVRGRTWRSSVSFMPQLDRQDISGLAGLAAQFGVQVPQANPASSPAFYAQLLQSREILEAAAVGPYEVVRDGVTIRGSLADLLEIRGEPAGLRTERTVLALRKRIAVTLARETSVVKLTVDTPWPTLSRDVAAKLVELVQDFNRERRAGQARAEREFVAERLAEVGGELRAAEDAVRSFQSSNRNFRGSPFLTLEMERLQRELNRLQSVYNGLSQSLEKAKIEEVRNTPVIAIIEAPEVPARALPRGALLLALTAFLTLLAVQGAWHFLVDVVRPRWRQRLRAVAGVAGAS